LKRLLLVSAAVALAVPFGLRNQSARAQGKNADTIVIGFTDALTDLDYADDYSTHGWEIFQNIGEGLLKYKPNSTQVEPGIATVMPTISTDGLTYTFTLLDNLQFADGTSLTAQTVVDSVNRTIKLKGQDSGIVTNYVDSVSAPDAKTVVFKLKGKTGLFTSLVALPPYYPVNPKQFTADAFNKFPASIDGNGPYRLVSYKPKDQAVLAANPKYHGAQPITPNIIIRYYQDATHLATAIQSGEIDVAWRALATSDVVQFKKDTGYTVYTVPAGGLRYLVFNHQIAPFDNLQVRQAIASLIDRNEIIDRGFQGQVKPLYSILPDSYLGGVPAFKTAYNSPQINKAVDLLKQAGYTAANPLKIDFWWPIAHYGVDISPIIKEQLERSGVIQVSVKTAEWSTYVPAFGKGGYGFYLLGWFPSYADPDDIIASWGTSTSNGKLGVNYANPQLDTLISQARESSDQAQRATLYQQAQQIWAQDVVTIPLVVVGEYTVTKTGTIIGADQVGAPLVMFYSVLAKPIGGVTASATMAATGGATMSATMAATK